MSFDDQPQEYDPTEAFKQQLEAYAQAAESVIPRIIKLQRLVAEGLLRDDFAKFALEGILSGPNECTPDEAAGWAYRVADAMLVARKLVQP